MVVVVVVAAAVVDSIVLQAVSHTAGTMGKSSDQQTSEEMFG